MDYFDPSLTQYYRSLLQGMFMEENDLKTPSNGQNCSPPRGR